MGFYIVIIHLSLVGKGAEASPFLNVAHALRVEGRKPSKDRARKAENMNKNEKMRGCVALVKIAVAQMQELRSETLKEWESLFLALGIRDKDPEKIEDAQLYKIALDLEYNAQELKTSAEDLESIIKDLEKISF